MEKHPFFNLQIFTKKELEHLLQRTIVKIQLVREWPLSSVVEVTCEDSSEWIVKYMREPLTIEGMFYRQVTRDFLPICKHIIESAPDQQTLIYSKISGVHPHQSVLNEQQSLKLLDNLQSSIQTLNEPGLPARILIDTPGRFSSHFEKMLEEMQRFIDNGKFSLNDQSMIGFLQEIIRDSRIVERLTKSSGYTHGDLASDNILLRPDGSFIILDWQRAVRASPLLDAFLFLDSMGIPPLRHLPVESLYLANLERIEWYVANAVRWNPAIIPQIDRYINEFVKELKLVYPVNTTKFKM